MFIRTTITIIHKSNVLPVFHCYQRCWSLVVLLKMSSILSGNSQYPLWSQNLKLQLLLHAKIVFYFTLYFWLDVSQNYFKWSYVLPAVSINLYTENGRSISEDIRRTKCVHALSTCASWEVLPVIWWVKSLNDIPNPRSNADPSFFGETFWDFCWSYYLQNSEMISVFRLNIDLILLRQILRFSCGNLFGEE